MTQKESFLKGLQILAVDDEEDILEAIEELLEDSHVDSAFHPVQPDEAFLCDVFLHGHFRQNRNAGALDHTLF